MPRFLPTDKDASPSANFISPGTKEFVCSLSHTQGNNSGEIMMPTPKEYRVRARECLELTDEAKQWYVKAALLQLAAEFQRRAERLEHSNEIR
jgi:hypothetical protein